MTWYKRWFSDDRYVDVYAHRDAKEARDAINLFLRITDFRKGTPILDLACGTGRHAFVLARKGYSVVAADLSAKLLSLALEEAPPLQKPPAFVRADMRTLPFNSSFGAVLQLFTAFGYFPDEAQDEQVIQQVCNALLPAGWYMLDFLNSHEVRRNIIPFSETKSEDGSITQERSIRGNRVEKRITIRQREDVELFTESVRLYSPDELRHMLVTNGFSVRHVAGSYDGSEFVKTSPRCILFSKKR